MSLIEQLAQYIRIEQEMKVASELLTHRLHSNDVTNSSKLMAKIPAVWTSNSRTITSATTPVDPPSSTISGSNEAVLNLTRTIESSSNHHRPILYQRLIQFVCLVFMLACCLSVPVATNGAVLEPGEVERGGSGSSPVTPLPPLEEGPSTIKAATCDSAQSRKARQIVKELFLSQLPTNWQLPPTCPFHPSLDLLVHEDSSKTRITSILWQCLKCNRLFRSQKFVDDHIQQRHMQHAGQNSICLADYCDILDCLHRSVTFDPLTGEILSTTGDGGRLPSAAGQRAQRLAEARAASLGLNPKDLGLTKEEPTPSTTGRPESIATEHPHARRCNAHAMELARLKCSSVLLQCLPLTGEYARMNQHLSADYTTQSLLDQFQKSLCDSLRCTEDGYHANAVEIVNTRANESRTRLYTLFLVLALFAIGVFYFLLYHLRTEFGFKPKSTTRVGGGNLYTGTTSNNLKERQLARLASWLGYQQKKKSRD